MADTAWGPVRNIPKSQVYQGSRGHHTGRIHLAPIGAPYAVLCGRHLWTVQPAAARHDAHVPPCPACQKRAAAQGITWPELPD